MVMNIKPKVVSFNSASKNQFENVHTKSHTAETRNISKISKKSYGRYCIISSEDIVLVFFAYLHQ